MKKLLSIKNLIWLILSFSSTFITTLYSQNYIINSPNSSITVLGTSNVHDWEIKVNTIKGELSLDSSKKINSLSIKIPVISLKSGNGIMDGKTHKALEFEENPIISFQFTGSSSVKFSENETEIILTGNLTIAGETRNISISCMAKITKSGDYQLKGSVPLKMTSFKIKPPTAFFGSMKTGDAVTVKFDVTFKG